MLSKASSVFDVVLSTSAKLFFSRGNVSYERLKGQGEREGVNGVDRPCLLSMFCAKENVVDKFRRKRFGCPGQDSHPRVPETFFTNEEEKNVRTKVARPKENTLRVEYQAVKPNEAAFVCLRVY